MAISKMMLFILVVITKVKKIHPIMIHNGSGGNDQGDDYSGVFFILLSFFFR